MSERIIKFRAWFVNHKRMYDAYEFMGMSGFSEWVQGKNKLVIPMQFTGLFDKNGNEIYESDIVRYSGAESCHKVKWDLYKWTRGNADLVWTEDLEVIGNIFQNPDLLPRTQKGQPK
jgi:hypothetical protein